MRLGPRFQQKRASKPDQRGKARTDQEGKAPITEISQDQLDQRDQRRADTNAAECYAGSKAAIGEEPALHSCYRRHICEADANTDQKPVAGEETGGICRRSSDGKAKRDQKAGR